MLVPRNVINMKRVDGILITVTGYSYNPGTVKLKNKLDEKQFKDFTLYMASVLGDEFVRAIDTQRYKSNKWPPLSVKYYAWKQRKSLSLNIWEATGYLKENIKIFKKGNFIAVGFRQKDYYPNSRVQVNKVARYVEYGTNGSNGNNGMPPRPLFRPIVIHVRKHVDDYYRKYKRELSKIKKDYIYLK